MSDNGSLHVGVRAGWSFHGPVERERRTMKRSANPPSEARIQANRANAKKSTGPKTVDGKTRSRANALKHGFCATVLPIPGEDPEKLAARGQEWVDHYQPQSPAAKHFLMECVRATVLADRLAASHHAFLSFYRRHDATEWLAALKQNVRRFVGELTTNPEARTGLLASSFGCRELIRLWEGLRRLLERTGTWDYTNRNWAASMLGCVGGGDAPLADRPEIWMLYVRAACVEADPQESRYRLDTLFRSYTIPNQYFGKFTRADVPDRETAARALLEMIDTEIAQLRALADEHEQTREVYQRGLIVTGSMIQHMMKDSHLALRYQTEARISFQSNYKGLVTALQHDRDNPPAPRDEPAPACPDARASSPPPPAPEPPAPPPPSTPAAPSRNEPNAAPVDALQEAFLDALASANPVPSMILFPAREECIERARLRPPARRRGS